MDQAPANPALESELTSGSLPDGAGLPATGARITGNDKQQKAVAVDEAKIQRSLVSLCKTARATVVFE